MAINTIHHDDSLDHIWSVLVYEEARLLTDKDASDLAPEAGALVERWAQVNAGQRSAWRAEIVAQAGVDTEDDLLDDTVDELDNELLRAFRDRDAPQRRRYFKKARHEIVRLGLESQLEVVRAWPASLKSEREAALQALGARLEEDIARGDVAVEERLRAAAATADQRVREIVRFVDDINAARRTRYGLLIQRAEERRLPKDWPGRFFKKSSQGSKKAKTAPAVENPPA
ncbi:hypothetical protein [Sorangium cellulosum]|uniref:Uncharacterized protein n=2 Tax=Sorangium cellulosum TaxID=56 RepID=S4YAX5_SORCE|nr:hypothetical protein [Sorangium cellulosum]AGP41456.1 hypothetical protein SCE1572_47410 [Sorangium cellulosum So0157-2]